jgi:twitching motility protein PilT
MRDMETVESTLRVAETGHLTFSTLHTNSAAETVSRIVDVFPAGSQAQVRIMLSMCLQGVISQALLPQADGKGRVVALEILLLNPAVRNLIRENKIHQIYSTMQMGQSKFGMQTFNQSLADLYFRKLITLETAMDASSKREELTDMIQRGEGGNHLQSSGKVTQTENSYRRQ